MKLISTFIIILFSKTLAFSQGFNVIPESINYPNPILESVTEIDTTNWGIDNDTYNDILLSVTEADTSHWGTHYVPPKDTFSFSYSGRQYLDATWRGFSNLYGLGFHQFSQGMGTTVDPGITRQRNGYTIPFDATILYLYLNGYHNNNENMDIEIDITCFSSSDNSNLVTVKWRTKFNYNSNNTSVRIFDIPINQAVAQGDEIIVSMRKPAGGTRRYYYHNATMYFEK